MKSACVCLVLCLFLSVAVSARETQKIPIEKLGDLVLQDQEGLVINNINFVVEEAFFGGVKATIQCTGKNKTTSPLNYTFYVAAFDKADNLVACLGPEPFMNVHEPGKVETLEASGMIDPENKNRVSYFLLRVVVQ
ncbi:MAG: hypothetical protein K9K63_18840 [Desulfotignum sp.]|nr:hypothetical protein [Desulfotignum sp.]